MTVGGAWCSISSVWTESRSVTPPSSVTLRESVDDGAVDERGNKLRDRTWGHTKVVHRSIAKALTLQGDVLLASFVEAEEYATVSERRLKGRPLRIDVRG